MNLTDWSAIASILGGLATLLGVPVALLVYVKNSYFQRETHRFQRLAQFLDVHRRLFRPDGYIMLNVTSMINGTYVRDMTKTDMEVLFHETLLEVERLAILENSRAVSRPLQIYMFAWYAKHLLPALSAEEHHDMYWELALNYLTKLVADAHEYELEPIEKRKLNWEMGDA